MQQFPRQREEIGGGLARESPGFFGRALDERAIDLDRKSTLGVVGRMLPGFQRSARGLAV